MLMTILAPGCSKLVHNLGGLKMYFFPSHLQKFNEMLLFGDGFTPRLLQPCGSCFFLGLNVFSSSWWVGSKERGKQIYLSTQTPKGDTLFLTTISVLFFSWKLKFHSHTRCQDTVTHSPSWAATDQQQADTTHQGGSAGCQSIPSLASIKFQL